MDELGNERIEMFKINLVDKFILSLDATDKVAFEATGNSLFLYKKLFPVLGDSNITVVNTCTMIIYYKKHYS